ncbi:zinc finger MYM-type protein 1-like [Triplophysa rosa]|uniref:zinc finger MYM-type protein 1-like n=1 Tax=Triplophysa rosa TaxID=992332 RepID=UPI0025463455|nr:zinc finger MYM-type protein 1-like [Triplophysa rosa]
MDRRTFFKSKTSCFTDLNNNTSNSSLQSGENVEELPTDCTAVGPGSSSQGREDNSGNVTNKRGTPVDLGTKDTGPSQPCLPEYPKTLFSKQNRSFSSEYYKTYKFIEYSKEGDAVFCFPCRLFQCSSSAAYRDPAFVINGVRDWKKILAKLQKHADGAPHRQCTEQWHCFEQTKATGSVATLLSESHKTTVQANREYAETIVDILLNLGKQGLSLRGHDEGETSENRGNFLELCNWYARHDRAFSARLNAPFNLTSPDTQNKFLEIAAHLVKDKIIHSIEENGFFAVLVDEARSFKEEQMAVCVRYTEKLEIKEPFLGFVDCSERVDAIGIYGYIKHFLGACGIYSLPTVGQSYDGAAVMSGHVNEVQQKLRQDHPCAVYIHCMAHKLNLVLVDACKVNRTANTFFHIIESLYAFFSQPGTHHAYQKHQKELGVKAELTALSNTRWACRWKNIAAVKSSMRALLSTLSEFAVLPFRRFVEASGLLSNLKKTAFCVCLVVFYHVLSMIHVAHKALQKKDTTLSQASSVMELTIKSLESMRTSDKWEELWMEIEAFCNSLDIQVNEDEREHTHKRPMKRTVALDSCVVTSSVGQREYQSNTTQSVKEKWAQRLYFPVLDTLLGECQSRFSTQTMEIARSVDAVLKCDPEGAQCLLNEYATALSINPKLAYTKMNLVKMNSQHTSSDFVKEALSTGFNPNFEKLFKLALTLPVGTATCERSFSAMRRVRNWMRSTMCQERLSSLSLLHIESDITAALNIEDIISAYHAKSKRRMLLH